MEAANIPPILNEIRDFLSDTGIEISDKVEGEGRGGSLIDEGSIKRALQKHHIFKDHIIDESARKFGDMLILDYDKVTTYPVNIKTSIGSTDNCFSKAGMVYAFTDLSIDDIPKAMNLCKMISLIETHGKHINNRDYWFLCIDKNDSTNVIIRGAKQINCWVENINPSNVLQVNWKKEKTMTAKERTWEEAYELIIGGAKRSIQGFIKKSIPKKWLIEAISHYEIDDISNVDNNFT